MAWRTQSDKETSSLQAPHSLDAEVAVLGSILKDQDALNQTIEIFDSEVVFYYPKHGHIFRAVLSLYERNEPCDITTLSNELLADGRLETIGGRVYLVELAESVATTANIESYARIVQEKYLLRRLIQTSNEIVRSSYDLDQPVDALLDMAESNIFDISEKRLRKGFTHIKDLMPATYEQIENLQTSDSSLSGLATGFTDLDTLTNGMHKGEFIVIAGRPSMGKTSLAMNIAEYVAAGSQKRGVGIFSIEMSEEQLAFRMLCGRAGIPQHKLRSRKLSDQDWQNLSVKGGVLAEAPIFIDDSAALTSLEMRAKARRLKAQHGVDLIIVDYIQMMTATGRIENRQQEMSVISRNLKALAKEIEVPVIALSQLSRMVEQRGGEKRPQLSDLRESGAIEQDADVVMFVYRPEFYLTSDDRRDPKNAEKIGIAEIIVAKQRNGPTGTVKLTFRGELTRFESLEQRHAELPPGAEAVDGHDIPF